MFRFIRADREKTRRSKQYEAKRRRQGLLRSVELLEPRLVLSADLAWAFDLDVSLYASSQETDVQEADEHVLATDAFGNFLYSEPVVDGPQAAVLAAGESGDAAVWQGYDFSETFLLHSNPGADHVIYLDFDGHVTSGTAWNDAFAGGEDIVTPSFSTDGDSSSFSDSEKALIQRVWARVAEDFAPFDLDVTTEEPPLDRLIKSGVSDTQWGTRAVIGPNTWFDPAGGVAYVGSFNWSTDAPCFIFNTSENGIAESVSHESGHALGLGHDGNASTTYYTGHGSGATSWGPIMGAPYSMTLTQWARGEYYEANNSQDDLSIISSQNGFGYRPDDFGDTLNDATALIVAGQSQIDAFYGVIEQNTDFDMFSFQAGAGSASLAIDPLAIGPNLDILAELYNSTGALIASSNPIDDIDAAFTLSLPTAGNYFLRISGTGRGDPLTDGYTTYGSLGNYRITGNVSPYMVGNSPPVAVDDQATTAVNEAIAVDVLANDSDANSDPLGVTSVTQGNHGTVAINPDKTVTYTPSSTFVGVDSFSYTISDDMGGFDTAWVTITVTAPAALVNGDFEQGLVGWEFTGDASAQTASFGETPAEGQNQGVLTTANSPGGNITVAAMESFLGLGDGMLEAVAPGTATAGSVMRQQVTAMAGQTLVLQYNFATDESTPDGTYNDFSFMAVSGPTGQEAFLLADTTASGFSTSSSTYKQSTGYRQFTYTFAATGLYTIGFGVSDSKDTSYDTALLLDSVSIETSANSSPTATNDAVTTAENQSVTIDVVANDYDGDGDTLTIVDVTQGASGSAQVNGDNTIAYTPDANYHGTDTFTYTISDSRGGQSTATVTVTVTEPPNNPPNPSNDNTLTNEDTTVVIEVLTNDSDPNGDVLTIAGLTQPSHGTAIVSATDTVSYTPAVNYHGTDTFAYTVDDGKGGQASATVTVTIASVNDLPTATDDSASVMEDGVATIGLLANDSDVDGDILTISGVGQAAAGTTVLNGNGDVTYTPAADFWGTDSFSYTIVDGNGGQATGTVLVTVVASNDAPAATDDNASTAAGSPVIVDVLGNDGDVDGDALSVTGLTQPSSGAAVVNADQTITYTPGGGFTGQDAFTYTINDGHGATSTATVIVSVSGSSGATIDGFENGLGAWVSLGDATTQDAMFGEAPVAGQYQAVLTTTNAMGGDVSVANLETFLGVSSGSLDATTAGTATAGSAIRRTLDVTAGQTLRLQFSFLTDELTPDTNYNDFAFITVVGPGVDMASLLADTQTTGFVASPTAYSESTGYNSYDFTFPNAGQYVIGIGVSDARDTSYDSALLLDEISLSGTTTVANAPPVAAGDTEVIAEDSSVTVAVLANDSDSDGDTLTVTSVTQASHGSVVINSGTDVTYTPQANYYGTDTFTYTVDDGHGGQDSALVTVTINSMNDAPIAVDDTAAATSAATTTIDVIANDSDVDGDTLSVTAVTQPANGTVVVNQDNSLSYTPDADFVGDDSFSYAVGDGQGGQDWAIVAVTVTDSASGLANGGFEDALEGWESTGDAGVQTAAFGESPVAGQYQGIVTSANTMGGNVSVANLEVFLGLASGTLNGVTTGTATAGSAIRQTVTVSAGQQLVFQYNFATDENTPESTYNDFSFLSIVGPDVQAAMLMADTHAASFGESSSAYKSSTGYRSFSYEFAQAGQYTIGFGVADAKDTSYDSALLLDAISLQPSASAAASEAPVCPSEFLEEDLGGMSSASKSVVPMPKGDPQVPQATDCNAFQKAFTVIDVLDLLGFPAGKWQFDDTDAADSPSKDWTGLVDQIYAEF